MPISVLLAIRAQAALIQCLLHATHRAATSDDLNAALLRGGSEGLHDVVTEKIGQQNDELSALRQLQGSLLVRRIATTDVVRDRNVVAFQ